jgi:hypothetical protein
MASVNFGELRRMRMRGMQKRNLFWLRDHDLERILLVYIMNGHISSWKIMSGLVILRRYKLEARARRLARSIIDQGSIVANGHIHPVTRSLDGINTVPTSSFRTYRKTLPARRIGPRSRDGIVPG